MRPTIADELETYGDVPAPVERHEGNGNGYKKIIWTVAVGSIGINVAVLIGFLAWGNRQIDQLRVALRDDVAAINNKLSDQRDQHYGLQVETQRAISELAIQTARAAGEAARAVDRSMLAERESRLAQEDLTLMRAAVRASGIRIESAGDHD